MKQITQFETFKELDNYDKEEWARVKPSCHNRFLRITKYRVTIEEVDEPDEVIRDRIRQLWHGTTNHYHRDTLRSAAREYGILDELIAK